MTRPRILVAGIGNIFLGDDAFGVEVAQRLLRRVSSDEVHIVDMGIRGMDLAFALLNGYEAVILVDATARGGPPGTLYVLEPARAELPAMADMTIEGHSLSPAKVLRLVAAMGGHIERLFVVGCEPTPADFDDVQLGLSAAVNSAIDEAVTIVETLVTRLLRGDGVSVS
jgi:hydrogenase maturation protease